MRSNDREEHGDWIDGAVWTKEALADSERIAAERKLRELRERIMDQWDGWHACGLLTSSQADILAFYAKAIGDDA